MTRKLLSIVFGFLMLNMNAQNLTPIVSISASGSVDSFKGGYTFAYATSGTPWNGSLISYGGFYNSYDTQISSDYGPHGGNHISFRTRNGDSGIWNPWVELATKGANNFVGNQVVTGNTSTSPVLEIKASAATGSETLLKLSVNDAAQDYLKIVNATGDDKRFIPLLQGYHVTDNRAALYLTGMIETVNDSGENPIMVFDSRLSGGVVSTRPLFSWDSYGNRKMVLTSNGSLGIGTNITGNHKLAVEGSIAAREIKVQATGWADFVFKKDYDLPTLEEVEKHIFEKGHLENIPSEEEVLSNGINLGEMNTKLLQKIEELTLYIIEQNKEIEELKKGNKNFKYISERLSEIEKKIKIKVI